MTASPGVVIDANPIINDPFSEPTRYWHFGDVTPELREGRRTAGYLATSPDGQLRITDDLIPLEVVNDLRGRVSAWRQSNYPGTSQVTRDLFDYWFDEERRATNTRPFFCQQEAVETIAFLTEAPADLKVGVSVPASGEVYQRLAVKLATGGGKTLVMSMLIAWAGFNCLAWRPDERFTGQFLVVAPILTVRDWLSGAGGLAPRQPESLYEQFDLVPPKFSTRLGQPYVQVATWHQLAPKEDP